MKKRTDRTLATRTPGRKPRNLPQELPALLLLTDSRRLPDPLPAAARLPRGSGVILRHYEWPRAQRLALAIELARLCRRRGLLLLVAGDAGLALAAGAAGVHLPEGLGHLAAGLRRQRRGWIVTQAAHGAGAVARAARIGTARNGADAVLVSPVFPTASHPGAAGLGVVRFAALAMQAARNGLAVYALGGVTAANARRLCGIPLAGLAGISGMTA
ncbi:thiamine phosphate synthase [Ferrovibrio xuzhouensis]|uniref:Thiamine phosphate synthase n=1 Tax=Ferrovibrio xuzhouensis TaxID=1576914 RepID=A0ABV7VAB9_9PROT